MLIRKAETADIPDLLRLLVQVCNVHQDIRPDIFKRDGVKYTESDLTELLADSPVPGLHGLCAPAGRSRL